MPTEIELAITFVERRWRDGGGEKGGRLERWHIQEATTPMVMGGKNMKKRFWIALELWH